MKFEYDDNKSRSNKEKHGVDFEQAQLVWFSDNIIIPAKTNGEARYMIIGKINTEIFSCVFTPRNEKIRIISCRKSRDYERKIYHEKIA